MYRILTLLIVLCLAPAAAAQTPAALAEQPIANGRSDQEKTIQFSFENADWKDVIPWFAQQTGFSWQSIEEEWPKDTFTLSDDRTYTPMEALDQLNYALRLRKPPYTIVRNNNQLILTQASAPLPAELIETITPDELDQRGDYEIVRCKFSLGDINIATVEQDLRQSISQRYQQFAKALLTTNEFSARETGANLRKIHNAILAMKRSKSTSLSTYALKHYDPEQFLIVARPLVRIETDAYRRDDGTLIIVIDPSANRFILQGTPTAIEDFKKVAAIIDVAADEVVENTEGPYLKSYPVFTDPEIALKVVETMLDGTDATIGQDEGSGAIILRGRKEHHKNVEETIATLRGESGTTKIIQLKNSSASTILSAVQSLMSQTAPGIENPNGPKLLANTVQNYIVIRGTPAEIFDINQIITKLDQAQELDPNRRRTNTRMLKMPAAKRDDLIHGVEDLMRSTGRRNSLRIIMPEDRQKSTRGPRRYGAPGSSTRGLPPQSELKETLVPPAAAPSVRDTAPTSVNPNDGGTTVRTNGRTRRTASKRSASAASGLLSFALTSLVAYQPQDAAGDTSESLNSNADYTPPEAHSSVPGSPVVIRGTDFGILLESDDLDALDDLERLLLSEAGETGTDQGLSIFYLKFKKSASIKSVLDEMFGLAAAEGGGGGGDLLSGIVGNMAGEGAGDLLGGVLGGGGSSSSNAVISLEGDVQIGMYSPLNLLYVSGATQSDLQTIEDAINIFDQPSPPQAPELAGQFHAIPIKHRDPEEILQQIQTLYADYIQQSNEQPQQKEGGGNAPEQVAKAMRNIAGTGGGNKKGGKAEQELPKVRLALDMQTKQILLTGPAFIAKEIRDIVEELDQPKLETTKQAKVLPLGTYTEATMKIIQERFGIKIVPVDDAEAADSSESQSNNGSSSNGSNRGNNNNNGANGGRNSQRQNAELNFLRRIQNRGEAAQRRGGAQRGRDRRGGGDDG